MRCTHLLTIASFAILSASGSSDPNANPVHSDGANDDDDDDDVKDAELIEEYIYTKIMDETVTLPDMWAILDCEDIMEQQRPIHNESTWVYLRGAYIASVGYPHSSIAYDQIHGNGFPPDSIIVKHHPVKGRALFANQFFRKGDTVWVEGHCAYFQEGVDYRSFLASIPAHLACDVFLWAYSGKSYGVCVDLDEGSLINHASDDDVDRSDRPNMQRHVATRDIHPGDEIITDYGEFSEAAGWAELGLGSWGESDENLYYDYGDYVNDDTEDAGDAEDAKDAMMKEEL